MQQFTFPKVKKQRTLNMSKQHTVQSTSDVFILRFDQDDQYLAAGFADGAITLLRNKEPLSLASGDVPITSLRWRPNQADKAKGILVSSNADGAITYWHAPSGKKLHSLTEESTLCMDFNFDGSLLATGGKDFCIRIYDDNIKSVQHTFLAADWGQRGHANRVFCVKFLPEDPNILISGGWDANILIWDIREKHCIGQFYGPSIAGDGIDYSMKRQLLVTASHRTEHQLQLWDWRMRKLYRELEAEEPKTYYMFSAQFSKANEDYVYAGTSGVHELRMFNVNDGQLCGGVVDLPKSVYTLDQMNTNDQVAFSGLMKLFYGMCLFKSKPNWVKRAIDQRMKRKSIKLESGSILAWINNPEYEMNNKIMHIHDFARQTKRIGFKNAPPITAFYQKYLTTKPSDEELFNILKLPITRDADELYAQAYVSLLTECLQRPSITIQQHEILLNSSRMIFDYPESAVCFETLCSKLTNQYSAYPLLAKLMKAHRLYDPNILDRLNVLLLQWHVMNPGVVLLYLQTLVRAGNSLFPEVLYQMREHYLSESFSYTQTDDIFALFDVFMRCRLPLMSTLNKKLIDILTPRFTQMKSMQKIMFLFLITKSNFTFDFESHLLLLKGDVAKYNPIQAKMLLLTLSNCNCNNTHVLDSINLTQVLKKIKVPMEQKEIEYLTRVKKPSIVG